MQKIKDFIKTINPLKAIGFGAAYVGVLLLIFWAFHTNDTIAVADNGNVAVYPSVWKSIWLFLDKGWNFIWGILSLVSALGVGVFLDAAFDDRIDWTQWWQPFLYAWAPAVATILITYVGADNIGQFTHHTFSKSEYQQLKAEGKEKHVDNVFYEANQPDSLFFHSFGKNADQ